MCFSRTFARPVGPNRGGVGTQYYAPEPTRRPTTAAICCNPTEGQMDNVRERNLLENPLFALSERAEMMVGNRTLPPNQREGTAICRHIEDDLNNNIASNISSTPCPGRYKCVYSETRYPRFFIHVDCSNQQYCVHPNCLASSPQKLCVGMRGGTWYALPILRENGCVGNSPNAPQCRLVTESVYVGCKCGS